MINRIPLKYVLIGVAVSALALLLFGVPTALVPTPFYTRMIPPNPLDYIFWIATSSLLGVYITLQLYGHQHAKGEGVAAFGGAFGGILSFGCPICNKLLVAVLGTSTIMAYVDPYRPLLGALTLGVLGSAIYLKIRGLRACATCLGREATSEARTAIMVEGEREEKHGCQDRSDGLWEA